MTRYDSYNCDLTCFMKMQFDMRHVLSQRIERDVTIFKWSVANSRLGLTRGDTFYIKFWKQLNKTVQSSWWFAVRSRPKFKDHATYKDRHISHKYFITKPQCDVVPPILIITHDLGDKTYDFNRFINKHKCRLIQNTNTYDAWTRTLYFLNWLCFNDGFGLI